jgi:hypothetical protein
MQQLSGNGFWSAIEADAQKMKNHAVHGGRRGALVLAERTGLEPATPGVTGRYSDQLNYRSSKNKLGDPTGIRTPVLTVKG